MYWSGSMVSFLPSVLNVPVTQLSLLTMVSMFLSHTLPLLPVTISATKLLWSMA